MTGGISHHSWWICWDYPGGREACVGLHTDRGPPPHSELQCQLHLGKASNVTGRNNSDQLACSLYSICILLLMAVYPFFKIEIPFMKLTWTLFFNNVNTWKYMHIALIPWASSLTMFTTHVYKYDHWTLIRAKCKFFRTWRVIPLCVSRLL